MDVTTIAFLVLLGGTPLEHVIAMPSRDDCMRAGETASRFECLNVDQFDARLRDTNRLPTDMQPASGPAAEMPASKPTSGPAPGDTPASKPTVDPVQTETAITGMPSATQRRVRNALYPQPKTQLTPRDTPMDNVYNRRTDLNG